MKILILGSTGMLGQSLKAYFEKQQVFVEGIARTNANYNLDLVKDSKLVREIIEKNQYDVVINTVALVNLNFCELHPEAAYLVNTKIAGEISKICNELNVYFIQISTDHYYTGDLDLLHSEKEPVVLLNEYAKTKYLAEKLVELYSNSLIIRTNIVGFRCNKNLTFTEWIIDSLINESKITGYTDMFASSIDVDSFSEVLYCLIEEHATGLINVSADGVLSKYEFIYLFAEKLGKTYLIERGELHQTTVTRGNSLGLSVLKLKTKYPYIRVPNVYEVVNNLYEQYLKNSEEK